MADVSQISRDHGIEARAVIEQVTVGPLHPLIEGLDLAAQLKEARRAVCFPGKPNEVCAALVEMSLLIDTDATAAPRIRKRYAKLIAEQTTRAT